MPRDESYTARFETFRGRTAFDRLPDDERDTIRTLSLAFRLTFQEFRRLVDASRDLALWGEPGLAAWSRGRSDPRTGRHAGKQLVRELDEHIDALKRRPTIYPSSPSPLPHARERKPVVTVTTGKRIHGMCPVASERTVCCNLHTIDAVERCVFACSYCAVQTFYNDEVVFDGEFASKLEAIDIEPGRFYHFGTGQASDSLAWGNRGGILEALCRFAARHPNVLLELKTKSDNIRYFQENDVAPNVVCSWSLNTPVVIENEEHYTASLERRLAAARAVAGLGVKVGFHFHPIVDYLDWRRDYTGLSETVMEVFDPDDVLFVSLGSVTLIKPVLHKLRELGNPTRIHQAELVADPHGRLTYTDDVKVEMFSHMADAFRPWHERVFLYLCMEKASIWERSLGRVYASNEEFEADFGARTMPKLSGGGSRGRSTLAR